MVVLYKLIEKLEVKYHTVWPIWFRSKEYGGNKFLRFWWGNFKYTFYSNLSISTATMSCCDWLNVLGRTLAWNGIMPGLNLIFMPFTHCNTVGSFVISCQCGKHHMIWPALNEPRLESNICTSLIAGLHLNSLHTFGVEGLVHVRPALILPPSSILSLEGGLWTKNHFLSVDMGGTGDCLEFLGLYDCSDGHSSQNFCCV